ncbi:MAG TPA: hypothetical protein PKD64_05260 [Pirellulaceae bacterium]|nr:hypothetical protein [Pirellulaceae bacterium]HMO91585.1 hypothetical protein [Pirellulaceae bacterium]HMP68282.1 hypothetical protein [Pirellulaceae bacterium]
MNQIRFVSTLASIIWLHGILLTGSNFFVSSVWSQEQKAENIFRLQLNEDDIRDLLNGESLYSKVPEHVKEVRFDVVKIEFVPRTGTSPLSLQTLQNSQNANSRLGEPNLIPQSPAPTNSNSGNGGQFNDQGTPQINPNQGWNTNNFNNQTDTNRFDDNFRGNGRVDDQMSRFNQPTNNQNERPRQPFSTPDEQRFGGTNSGFSNTNTGNQQPGFQDQFRSNQPSGGFQADQNDIDFRNQRGFGGGNSDNSSNMQDRQQPQGDRYSPNSGDTRNSWPNGNTNQITGLQPPQNSSFQGNQGPPELFPSNLSQNQLNQNQPQNFDRDTTWPVRQNVNLGHDQPYIPQQIETAQKAPTLGVNLPLTDVSNQVPPASINANTARQSELAGQIDANHKHLYFLWFMLLFSVGLNFYLGWISRSFYVRYAELADELRETFSSSL